MTDRLDPQYAAQLMAAAVAATGPRPRSDKGGRWMQDVLNNATAIHRAVTPWGENPSLLERAVNAQRFSGVLLSVEPMEQGHRLEITFLPLGGKYAGKWRNPREKVPAAGPTPHDYQDGYEPFVETWAGPWIRDGRGQQEWDKLRGCVGQAFWYTCHREKEGEEGAPKGGYRVFDDLDGPAQVPEDLQPHVDRILRMWKIVAQVNETERRVPARPTTPRAVERDIPHAAAAAERVTTSRRDDGGTEYRVPAGAAPAYSEEDMAPFGDPDGGPSPAAHQPATDDDGPCDDLPDAIWSAINAGTNRAGAEPADRVALDALRAALKVIGRDAAPLAAWARDYGISDYSRPKTWDQYNVVVDGVTRIYCRRPLP